MNILRRILLFCVFVLLFIPNAVSAQTLEKEYTYGIKINDVLCGYSDIHLSTIEKEGKNYTLLKQEMYSNPGPRWASLNPGD